jgi:hypothetical protein
MSAHLNAEARIIFCVIIYCLFNHAVCSSECIVSKAVMISEGLI